MSRHARKLVRGSRRSRPKFYGDRDILQKPVQGSYRLTSCGRFLVFTV